MNYEKMSETLNAFIERVQKDCAARFASFPKDLYEPVLYEVACGLLSRQGTLVIELAMSPNCWNPHSAPLFQRAMSDAHITLAYILTADSQTRACDYVLYGLGQEKLSIAHHEALIQERGGDEVLEAIVAAKKEWLETQRFEFLTVVNVGSATGLSARDMADQSDLKGLYDFNFTPFSSCVHSTWQHVGRFNLTKCANPLHGGHRMPVLWPIESDWHELWVTARSLRLSLEAMDTYSGASGEFTSWDYLQAQLQEIGSEDQESTNQGD